MPAAFATQTHPYGFRSGQWARIVTVFEHDGRECWLVQFPDGETDWWPVYDPVAEYRVKAADEPPVEFAP